MLAEVQTWMQICTGHSDIFFLYLYANCINLFINIIKTFCLNIYNHILLIISII